MDLSLLLLGLLIGMRHALEADHVAAVASLVAGNSNFQSTVLHGVVWGVGHTITLFIFCSVALLVDGIIPNDFAESLEFAVGIMLILLGLDVLYRLYKKRVHFHTHNHGDDVKHFHAHSHKGKEKHNIDKHNHQHNKTFPKRALFVGLMHGMAGSAALIILTLNTVKTPLMALSYIAFFGIGSILGMALLSVVIAVPLKYSATKINWLYNALQISVAFVTLGIGTFIILKYFN
ncbi:MAG: urease accessory protein [Proteobacteria bacterium]|nr:urease accessory protein [Pseudomonadota bacterium]